MKRLLEDGLWAIQRWVSSPSFMLMWQWQKCPAQEAEGYLPSAFISVAAVTKGHKFSGLPPQKVILSHDPGGWKSRTETSGDCVPSGAESRICSWPLPPSAGCRAPWPGVHHPIPASVLTSPPPLLSESSPLLCLIRTLHGFRAHLGDSG